MAQVRHDPADRPVVTDQHSSPSEDSFVDDVYGCVEEFLDAFRNLDVERFMGLWASGSSVFHPFAQASHRLAGDEDVRTGWSLIFSALRASQTGPPYLELDARDIDIRPLGSDAALATFHLDLPDAVGRRSVLFERQDGAWKIVHLHASNVPHAAEG